MYCVSKTYEKLLTLQSVTYAHVKLLALQKLLLTLMYRY